jgi:hypothetical protein
LIRVAPKASEHKDYADNGDILVSKPDVAGKWDVEKWDVEVKYKRDLLFSCCPTPGV